MNAIGLEVVSPVPLYRQIETALREKIEKGDLPPGTPLPNTKDMAVQMGVHPLTLQKALRCLKNDGLIDRTPRLGSFVRGAVHAPDIALLLGPHLATEHAHFHRAMARALQLATGTRRTLRTYDGMSGNMLDGRSGSTLTHPALRHDCDRIAFRGIIAVGFGVSVWRDIAALGKLPYAWLGISSVKSDLAFDPADFAHSAVQFFAGRNRRHVAYLRTFRHWGWSRGDRKVFAATAAEHGIEKTEMHDFEDLDRGDLDEYATYKHVIAIIQDWRRTAWPDAIIVSDDIVMRSVALALLHVKDPAARRIDLLTWANDCLRFNYGLPVTRYEIPVANCARRLIEILDRRMNGKEPLQGQELIRGRIAEST